MSGLDQNLIRELIITDGGSHDATLQIAEEAGAHVITGAPSRGGQLRRGVGAASGAWLLILHADCQLPEGWVGLVQDQMRRHRAGVFRLRFDSTHPLGRLLAIGANMRTQIFGLPYGDQGLLVSRQYYDAVGGYPDIPLMEDVVLNRKLRPELMSGHVTTSAQRYERTGWARRSLRNLWTILRFLLGADPHKLARSYRKP